MELAFPCLMMGRMAIQSNRTNQTFGFGIESGGRKILAGLLLKVNTRDEFALVKHDPSMVGDLVGSSCDSTLCLMMMMIVYYV